MTLLIARRRGRALTSLGVSALLVGAAGWVGMEVADRSINAVLNQTTGDIRRIADVMVAHTEDSLHLWLNLTLITGAALVAFGLLVAVLGGLLRRPAK
jgi:vacuolar-type H+-ATPase subunit I/STV1